MANTATLPLLLKQLGLPCMLAHYDEQATVAEQKHWHYTEYLMTLSAMEAANRQQKRIARHIKEAKLPPGKTLDAFDFKQTVSINAAQVTALADNTSWVNNANNLVIFGPSGVGKTHLACAIAYRLIEQGVRCSFCSTTTLVQKLQHAKAEFRLPEAIAKLARIPLLILDDIGYVKKEEAETSVLFDLIADRYENKSLIITANQPFAQWDTIFPDNMMAVAAIDRLVHHATIINIEGQSFRKANAKNKQPLIAGGQS
jgi:DNA replication protein DnaC